MGTRIRSEKQLANDKACAIRMKAYHEEIKKAKEEKILEVLKKEFKMAKPMKLKKEKSVRELIDNYESDISITPLKNNPDELDIPVRTKRAYIKRKNIIEDF